ncbi:MAG: hypothetical protein AAF378_22680 [Cyanobacteria bacterium P01_A01_bin.84]
MIDFKLNIIQSLKISTLALAILSPSLITSEAIAGSLSSAKSFTGKINYTVTGGTLRSNPDDVDPCSVNDISTASLSNLPTTDAIKKAYLYWSGSGENIDSQVNFGGSAITADKTFSTSFFLSDPSLGDHDYYFFQGVKDVTDIVRQQGNGSYEFSNLTVDQSSLYCNVRGVLSGWSLVVVYEDSALPANKINTIQLYEGLEVSRNQTVNYTLSGIEVASDPIAKFSMLVWEGDESLGGTTESFAFNNNTLTDTYNPLQNQFNSSINTNQSITTYGVDFDTFDVSSYVTEGDTSITGTITTADDLVLQGAALMLVTNTVFAD